MAQGHGRNERELVPPPQYEIDPGILCLASQPLSLPDQCSSIAVQHLGCYELKIYSASWKDLDPALKYTTVRPPR